MTQISTHTTLYDLRETDIDRMALDSGATMVIIGASGTQDVGLGFGGYAGHQPDPATEAAAARKLAHMLLTVADELEGHCESQQEWEYEGMATALSGINEQDRDE